MTYAQIIVILFLGKLAGGLRMNLEVDKIINDLVEKTGLRLTAQRRVILETLIENSDKHLSANELYFIAKAKDNYIGIATIYRTIDILEKMRIIDKRDFGDDAAKYEFILKDKGKHHHLICSNCGKVMEISGLLPEDLQERLLEEKGFQFIEHRLKIYGYCKECRNNLLKKGILGRGSE